MQAFGVRVVLLAGSGASGYFRGRGRTAPREVLSTSPPFGALPGSADPFGLWFVLNNFVDHPSNEILNL